MTTGLRCTPRTLPGRPGCLMLFHRTHRETWSCFASQSVSVFGSGYPTSPFKTLRISSNRTRKLSVRPFATMETGQGSSTVTVSPPEIIAGKEIQPSAPKAILRTDYRPTPYLISNVHLTFLLGEETRVQSKLSFTSNNKEGSPPALVLDGDTHALQTL